MAVDPDKPFNREEMYLAKAAGEGTTVPDEPWSRKEAYLEKISGRIDEAEEDISELDEKVAALATDISLKGGVADYAHLPTNAAIGDAYITEDTGILYVWVGSEWVAVNDTGVNVVQTSGTSTTDVMSQNATTAMVFANPGTNNRIGIGASSSASGTRGIAIGESASAGGSYSVALGASTVATTGSLAFGWLANAARQNSVALGYNSYAGQSSSVALGFDSSTTRQGEVNIGSGNSQGYNNTKYRVIGGVHDPVDAHDAATKGYVDTHLGGLSFVALTQTEYNNLGTKDPNTLYIIKAA